MVTSNGEPSINLNTGPEDSLFRGSLSNLRLFSWETFIDHTFFWDENSSNLFLQLIADLHFNMVTHPMMQRISSNQPYHGCLRASALQMSLNGILFLSVNANRLGSHVPMKCLSRVLAVDFFETFPNK